MQQNNLEWKTYFRGEANLKKWREVWSRLLKSAGTILCFSKSTSFLLQKAYPSLNKDKILLKPHKVDPLAQVKRGIPKAGGDVILGILGAINYSKGSIIIKELVKEIEKRNLPMQVVLIGEISEPIKSNIFKTTGRYERKKLPQLVEDLRIDLFLIPSIWPETFSYTTQEIIMMDMPLMVFDLGAPAERVKKYEKGIVLKDDSIENILVNAMLFSTKD